VQLSKTATNRNAPLGKNKVFDGAVGFGGVLPNRTRIVRFGLSPNRTALHREALKKHNPHRTAAQKCSQK